MTEITAALVKELREATQAPMMDCKRALVETGGDIDDGPQSLEQRRRVGQRRHVLHRASGSHIVRSTAR